MSFNLPIRWEAILSHWRMAGEQAPDMSKISSPGREEVYTLLAVISAILEQGLCCQPGDPFSRLAPLVKSAYFA